MRRLLLAACCFTTAVLCLSAAAHAHKVNIFAYVDGDSIVTDSGYSRSKRVHEGVVEVYDAATGRMLLSGVTDDTGRLVFPIPAEARTEKADLRLLLKAGEGHQAEWLVRYDEYAPAQGSAAGETPNRDHRTEASPSAQTVALADVEAVVRRELEPVKRMLTEMNQSGPSVTEIVGGFGYIAGIFGLVAYFKRRKAD